MPSFFIRYITVFTSQSSAIAQPTSNKSFRSYYTDDGWHVCTVGSPAVTQLFKKKTSLWFQSQDKTT